MGVGTGELLNFYFAQAGYLLINTDQNLSTFYYNQYMDKFGNWYIQRSQPQNVAATIVEYKYFKGASDAATNWTNRASLSYGFPDAIMKDL